MAGQNTIAKTRRESLNLRFDLIRHIRAAVERNMAVRPERVPTTRRARFIKQTLLRDQHERALGNFSVCNVAFRHRNFVNAAADMNCACATTGFGFPRNRSTQRIINLKNSRPVLKRFQLAAISRWQLLTSDTPKFQSARALSGVVANATLAAGTRSTDFPSYAPAASSASDMRPNRRAIVPR